MKLDNRGIIGFIVCVISAVTFSVSVCEGREVFVVSANVSGDANYMLSEGDGKFSSLPLVSDLGVNGASYGNGIGDFDNDGDLDYVMGIGNQTGELYIFEKLGPGNQIGPPTAVASWIGEAFPMDMAVADFNGDGNLDVVLSFLHSANCRLYLGDGKLGFTGPASDDDTDSLVLENAAELLSGGADAAFFNDDEHVDFIIAPYMRGNFYIHLGNGDGTFQTSTFSSDNGDPYFGAAVADFDNDGLVDLAASYVGYIDLYLGNGDGTFGIEKSVGRFDYDYRLADHGISLSLLDNYDFNGDGNQDLVVANFGSGGEGVGVFLGEGNGRFRNPVISWGDPLGTLYAVSAPPGKTNKEPVAVVDPVYLEAFVGEEIVVDGSESYDEDGNIANYDWDFGDEEPAGVLFFSSMTQDAGDPSSEASASHVYNEAGSYTITLTVTDDDGATASAQAEVHVSDVPVVPVKVKFSPHRLNLRSRDKWLWATIRVPAGFDARKIDDSKVCVFTNDAFPVFAQSNYGRGFIAKLRKSVCRRKRSLTLRFDRQAVINAIGNRAGKFTLYIEGQILSEDGWSKLEGSATIRAIDRKKEGAYFYKFRKKQIKRTLKRLDRKSEFKQWKYYWH
jgi:hypothetical protein